MAEIKWIKLTTDMFDNRKIKHLRRLPEGNNVVLIWVMLLTMAGRCNSNGMIFLTENIPYTPKMLADELDFEESTVQLALRALEQLNMIVTNNGFFSIAGWEEYQNIEGMDKIREQNRIRQAKHREKQKLLQSNVTITLSNGTDIEEDKEIELEKDKEIKRTDYQQIADLYNETCVSFPRLKSLSDSRKKAIKARLNTYSVDDFKALFEKAEASDFLKGKNDRNWSATFDWLIKDSNMAKVLEGQYVNKPKQASGRKEMVPSWMNKPNKFHNYQQRDTDYDKLTAENDPLMAEAIRTAANDKSIRERAEALKKQFAGE